MHIVEAAGTGKASAFLDFGHLGARDDIAGSNLHFGGGILCHESFAFVVEQIAAFAACRLRNKYAGWHQPGGMELDEFQVFDGQPGAVGHGETVTSGGQRIGSESEHAAGAAGGNY